MQWGSTALAFYEVGAAAVAASVATLRKRLELSQAEHPSLAGHAPIARRLARFVPFYEYSPERFFCSDGAPRDIAERRRAAFEQLSQIYRARFAETIRCTAAAAQTLSDLQFTGTYRVPFQYRSLVRAHLPSASFVASSHGVTLTDLDGNASYDLTGSYGVNLFGLEPAGPGLMSATCDVTSGPPGVRLTENVSSDSATVSPLTSTVTVLAVSPGLNVSVPPAASSMSFRRRSNTA